MDAGVGFFEARKTSVVSNTIATFLPSSVNFAAILKWESDCEHWKYVKCLNKTNSLADFPPPTTTTVSLSSVPLSDKAGLTVSRILSKWAANWEEWITIPRNCTFSAANWDSPAGICGLLHPLKMEWDCLDRKWVSKIDDIYMTYSSWQDDARKG